MVAVAAVSPQEEPQGVPRVGLQLLPGGCFSTCPPPQEAGSRGWLDVVLAAPGLAKLGISPVGTQRCWGKAAFDQSSSRGKVSEPCSFCEHAAGDMNEWGGFPFSSAQF